MSKGRPPKAQWQSGDMSAPVYNFLTLVAPGSQIVVDGKWATARTLTPCGLHGNMCTVITLDDGWSLTPTLGHFRLNQQYWIRHQIGP